MRFVYGNLITYNSILTPSTYRSGYEITNVLEDNLDHRFAFVGAAGNIVIDLLSALAVKAIVIGGYNGTAAITIQGNATDSWGSPSYTTTVTPVVGTYYNTAVLFLTQTYRYWRIVVSDGSSGDIRIGKIIVSGTWIQLPEMDPELQHEFNTLSQAQISQGRQVYGVKGLQYFSQKIRFPRITTSARTLNGKTIVTRAQLKTFWEAVENVIPFYVLFWEDQLTELPPMYMVLQDPAFKPKWNKDHSAMSVEIGLSEVF
jgi:hypothetical protein